MTNPNPIIIVTSTEPKSICQCGHTGDGPNSEHSDTFQEGHGACNECDCVQFTWKELTPYGITVSKYLKAIGQED